MTIAQSVVAVIAQVNPSAYALEYGYAVGSGNRSRVTFQACRIIDRKHNRAGRVIKLIGEYYDGSRIHFTWTDGRGSQLAAA